MLKNPVSVQPGRLVHFFQGIKTDHAVSKGHGIAVAHYTHPGNRGIPIFEARHHPVLVFLPLISEVIEINFIFNCAFFHADIGIHQNLTVGRERNVQWITILCKGSLHFHLQPVPSLIIKIDAVRKPVLDENRHYPLPCYRNPHDRAWRRNLTQFFSCYTEQGQVVGIQIRHCGVFSSCLRNRRFHFICFRPDLRSI